jgi:hypothetical protein
VAQALQRDFGHHAIVVVHRQWCDPHMQRARLSASSEAALRWLEERDSIVQTPSQADDDLFTISYAQRELTPVVTNDNYRDHITRGLISKRWADARLIKYAFFPGQSGAAWMPDMAGARMLEEFKRAGKLAHVQ